MGVRKKGGNPCRDKTSEEKKKEKPEYFWDSFHFFEDIMRNPELSRRSPC